MSTLAVMWVLFFLYIGFAGELHTFLQVPLCLMAGIFYVYVYFPLRPLKTPEQKAIPSVPAWYDLIIILVGWGICIYVMSNRMDFIFNPHIWHQYEVYMSVVLFAIIFEGSRRSMGWVIPLIAVFMCFYAFILGDYLPGRWWFGGVDIQSVFANRFLRSDMGYWGTLPKLACVMMPLFLVFGPILFSTGAGELFMQIASIIGNRMRGGAAQVSIISSALFGTISGAAVANTATTGTMTIPTMKAAGFSPEQAAAIESSASAGGQIMPPIMGATAFLMAEFLAVEYTRVALAALLPAIVYFFAVATTIYLMARRKGMEKPPKESIPKAKELLNPRRICQVIVPMGILIGMMVEGFTAEYSCAYALTAGILLNLFWSDQSWKERIVNLIKGVENGIKTIAWLLLSLVLLQTTVSLLGYSGLGLNFSATIFSVGSSSMLLAMILTAVIVLILGLGLNTTASYVIAFSVLGVPLADLGFDPFSINFFILYYAVLSTISPPVCNCVFIAASIAGAKWMRAGWLTCLVALSAFLLPFSFAFDPGLFMVGTPLGIAKSFITAMLSVGLLSIVTMGFFFRRATIIERVVFAVAAVLLLFPDPIYEGMGFVVGLLMAVYHIYTVKANSQVAECEV